MSEVEMTSPLSEPVWKRSASLLAVLGTSIALLTPLFTWVWSQSLRVDRVEFRIEQAKLPDTSDRLTRLEQGQAYLIKQVDRLVQLQDATRSK